MKTKIDVLDHGFVRLVSYMQPVDPRSGFEVEEETNVNWTGDLEIVRNARVSFNADWRTGEDEYKDAKLVDYMLRNKHTSPFESMVFTFEIKCPLFIARQWHRHRTWAYNEVSARYAPLDMGCYVPSAKHIGKQSQDNKQAREMTATISDEAQQAEAIIGDHYIQCHQKYELLLELGVPRELARSVLPVNAYTRFFGTVNLHNLLHFIRLRDHSHAQWEIQQYARGLKKLVQPIVPITIESFNKTLEAK